MLFKSTFLKVLFGDGWANLFSINAYLYVRGKGYESGFEIHTVVEILNYRSGACRMVLLGCSFAPQRKSRRTHVPWSNNILAREHRMQSNRLFKAIFLCT